MDPETAIIAATRLLKMSTGTAGDREICAILVRLLESHTINALLDESSNPLIRESLVTRLAQTLAEAAATSPVARQALTEFVEQLPASSGDPQGEHNNIPTEAVDDRCGSAERANKLSARPVPAEATEAGSVAGQEGIQLTLGDHVFVKKLTVIGTVHGQVTIVPESPEPVPAAEANEEMRRRALLRDIVVGVGARLTAPALEALEDLRRDTDRLIVPSSRGRILVDAWESVAEDHSRSYATSPPTTLLRDLLLDVSEIRDVLQHFRSSKLTQDLMRVLGQLAAIAGVVANDLGETHSARGWMRTARLAADEAGDKNLVAWTYAREAFFFLHYSRPPEMAVRLAEAAVAAAGSAPYAAAVMAPTVEARARARFGDVAGAIDALRRADDVFDRVGDPESGGLFGWTLQQLHFSAGKSLTILGQTRLALVAQDHAEAMFPAGEVLDPALVRLDRAQALIRGGEITEGCRLGVNVLRSLPAEFRSPLIRSWADEAVAAIPEKRRRLAIAREFQEAQALLM
ncbi:hypothetical protein [Frankia sp. Cas4]|uniref:hypothetical protein n=1 Tax=Frankia sp. Cas4 TaxID=3073927 RepID=UPI002AD1EFAE|nr:hypothetical protein [Frankia sp. Cas4]